MPLIFLVWVVLGWLQIVAAHTGGGEGFFNGLLVVNLADPGGDRFIQLGITLELRDEKVAERVKQYMPSIRDAILRLVSQHTAEDLLGREGKEQLALAIRKEVARPLTGETRRSRVQDDEDGFEDDAPRRKPAEPVRRVLFSSFIIQ